MTAKCSVFPTSFNSSDDLEDAVNAFLSTHGLDIADMKIVTDSRSGKLLIFYDEAMMKKK